MSNFASRLRLARREARLSQVELGQALGVSGQSVKEWEAGRASPHFDRLSDIARVTEKPLAWFFQAGEAAEGTHETLRHALGELDRLSASLDRLRERLFPLVGAETRPWSAHRPWARALLSDLEPYTDPARFRQLVDDAARARFERESRLPDGASPPPGSGAGSP